MEFVFSYFIKSKLLSAAVSVTGHELMAGGTVDGYDHRGGQDVMHRLSRFMGNVLNNFLCSNVFHHFSTHADMMSGFRRESQLKIM